MKHRCDNVHRASAERKRRGSRLWMAVLSAVPLVVGVGMILYASLRPAPEVRASSPGSLETPGVANAAPSRGAQLREKVVGRWLRPDGGYVLEIRSIGADGTAQTAYFNPQPINVARAQVRSTDMAVAVYVELRDTGYPGNYYKLNYDAQGDRLVGTYDQPEAGQRFDIYFERVK